MERKLIQDLLKWKSSYDRQPLIVNGARQVGKTHLLNHFGQKHYKNTVYFNFETNLTLARVFDEDIRPEKLLPQLRVLSGQSIFEEDTLVIFDEIQSCERALTSLKYFAEEAPAYHISAAGSLLGIAMNRSKYSFPVGKVQTMKLYPMDFEEFLWAMGQNDGVDIIRNCFEEMRECPLHEHFLELFRLFIVLGGMPRVIKEYLEAKDINLISSVQKELVNAYIADMSKYAGPAETIRIMAAYNSIPAQLAKENRKFQYKTIKSNARAYQYEPAVEWLRAAGLIVKVEKINNSLLPLSANSLPDFFKIYMGDNGLLCSKYGLTNTRVVVQPFQIEGVKGAVAENHVAVSLLANGYQPYYWESDGKAEVDFVIQDKQGNIIPLEVKSSEHVKAKSLAQYIKRYSPEKAYRVSTKNFGKEGSLFSLPLYSCFCI